jgi:hypothetical protein
MLPLRHLKTSGHDNATREAATAANVLRDRRFITEGSLTRRVPNSILFLFWLDHRFIGRPFIAPFSP